MIAQTVWHNPTRPCVHPTCRDSDGNRRLTRDVMCPGCRNRYGRTFGWLVDDYVILKTRMPKPASGARLRTSARSSYGHPAEWASDMAAEIAGLLNTAENELRSVNDDGPALFVCPEPVKVNNAITYLEPRWDQFCTFTNADSYAEAVTDTHRYVRSILGYTKLVERLPVPCPSCDVAALTRVTGRIDCGNCGRIIREEDYGLFTRIILDAAMDDLIGEYDATHAVEL